MANNEKKKKRRILPIVIVCAVAVIGLGAYSMINTGSEQASAESMGKSATVQTGSITKTVVGTGTLANEESTDTSPH